MEEEWAQKERLQQRRMLEVRGLGNAVRKLSERERDLPLTNTSNFYFLI